MSSLMSSETRSKVYYDYNYRVLPPVQQQQHISDRSYHQREGAVFSNSNQQSDQSIPVLSWLFPPTSTSSSEVVLDYYDPEEEFGER